MPLLHVGPALQQRIATDAGFGACRAKPLDSHGPKRELAATGMLFAA